MIYFKSLTDNNDYVYSIDMLRLNFELKYELYDDFYILLNKFSNTQFCELKTYFNKSYGYRYLYSFIIDSTTEKCSFVIGLQLGSKSENKYKGFIEFNPNKCFICPLFVKIYNEFKSLCFSFKVVRYDLAIDIPCPRSNIKLIRKGNMNYSYEYYENNGLNCSSSVTEYCGRRNHNKFTKLYDKKAESNLDYDLTRIEFTFDRDYEDFNNLPKFIYVNSNNIDLNTNNLVLIHLLLESNDINYYLKLLSYRKRKTIETFLTDYYVNFNLNIFNILHKQVLDFEF